jgi:hypothetical protein
MASWDHIFPARSGSAVPAVGAASARAAAVRLMIVGGLGVIGSLALLDLGPVMGEDHSAGFTRTMLFAQAALSAAQIVSGVFVRQRESWAVRAALAICGLILAISVITDSAIQGFPAMVLNGYLLWYLVARVTPRLTGDSVQPGDLSGPVEVDASLGEAGAVGREAPREVRPVVG